jgi:hypothetical protein
VQRLGPSFVKSHYTMTGSSDLAAAAPTPIPIVIVAEFAVEAHRNALAIPTKARRFDFMSMSQSTCAATSQSNCLPQKNTTNFYMQVA